MSYSMTAGWLLLTGEAYGVSLVRDRAEDIDYGHFELDAMVASGDYLVALASQLETVMMRIEKYAPQEAAALDEIISQVEYVNQKFHLKK